MKIWILLAGDTPNRRGLPAAWPVEYSPTPKGAPWIETTPEDLEDRQASHKADYDRWDSDNRPAPVIRPTLFVAEDGRKYKINAAGKLVLA